MPLGGPSELSLCVLSVSTSPVRERRGKGKGKKEGGKWRWREWTRRGSERGEK